MMTKTSPSLWTQQERNKHVHGWRLGWTYIEESFVEEGKLLGRAAEKLAEDARIVVRILSKSLLSMDNYELVLGFLSDQA
mmetsp:Transcript_39451/g.55558  ORF Transcript_39451/g.55558 Transcript_39451/m.55558 type:complete len:80 (-) Transcript_39451:1089-1328(-)